MLNLEKNQIWRDKTNGDVIAIDAIERTPDVIEGGWESEHCECRLYIKRKLFGLTGIEAQHFRSGRYERIRALRLRWLIDKLFGTKLFPIPLEKQTARIGDVTTGYDDVRNTY